MTNIIYNSLKSSDLDVTILQNPGSVLDIAATRLSANNGSPTLDLPAEIAYQINNARSKFNPPMFAVDLKHMIADVVVSTAAQGAGVLEVHIIDPYWMLMARDPQTGGSFIDVDPNGNGFLWPPIEVNFPPDVSDARWRLCQCNPSTDITQANMILTFEDAIVAELREHDAGTDPSLAASQGNETRAKFIERCVHTVNANKLKSDPSPAFINFQQLLEPSDLTIDGLTGAETTIPASSTLQNTIAGIRSIVRDHHKSPTVDLNSGNNPRGTAITGSPANTTNISLATGKIDYTTPWWDQLAGIENHLK